MHRSDWAHRQFGLLKVDVYSDGEIKYRINDDDVTFEDRVTDSVVNEIRLQCQDIKNSYLSGIVLSASNKYQNILSQGDLMGNVFDPACYSTGMECPDGGHGVSVVWDNGEASSAILVLANNVEIKLSPFNNPALIRKWLINNPGANRSVLESLGAIAALHNSPEAFNIIIARNVAVKFGYLMTASIIGGCEECVDILFRKATDEKMNINIESNAALQMAAGYGNTQIVNHILEHGASPNAEAPFICTVTDPFCDHDTKTLTPLLAAAKCQDASYFLDEKIPFVDKLAPELRLRAQSMRHKCAEVAMTLLAHGANPNAANKDGKTPLMIAKASGFTEMVQLLLQAQVIAPVTQKTNSSVNTFQHEMYHVAEAPTQ
jgi:hypothetical protein